MERLNGSFLPIGVCRINSKNVWGKGLGKDCDLNANSWYHSPQSLMRRLDTSILVQRLNGLEVPDIGRGSKKAGISFIRWNAGLESWEDPRSERSLGQEPAIPWLLEDLVVILTTWYVMFIVWRKERGFALFNWLKCSWRELWRCPVELRNLGRS